MEVNMTIHDKPMKKFDKSKDSRKFGILFLDKATQELKLWDTGWIVGSLDYNNIFIKNTILIWWFFILTVGRNCRD